MIFTKIKFHDKKLIKLIACFQHINKARSVINKCNVSVISNFTGRITKKIFRLLFKNILLLFPFMLDISSWKLRKYIKTSKISSKNTYFYFSAVRKLVQISPVVYLSKKCRKRMHVKLTGISNLLFESK